MRKIGIYVLSNPNYTLSECIQITSQVGFDYIATSIHHINSENKTDFLLATERAGLEIDNVHLSGSGMNNIWLQGDLGEQIIERAKKEMDISLSAGIKKGVLHVTWGYDEVPVTEIGIERFSRIVEYAEKIGYIIGFENSVSAQHLKKVLDAFQYSPSAMFTFDTGHWSAFCPQETIYEDYAQRIAITHLADNDGARDFHLIPFDGCIDYKKLAPSLSRLDRLTFEVGGVNRTIQSTAPITEEHQYLCATGVYKQGLVHFYDNYFTLYENLSYEGYLQWILESAKKLDKMLG